jgi:hypothetical protein
MVGYSSADARKVRLSNEYPPTAVGVTDQLKTSLLILVKASVVTFTFTIEPPAAIVGALLFVTLKRIISS